MAVEETSAEAPAPVETEVLPAVETPDAPASEPIELHTDTPSALSEAVAEGAETKTEPEATAEPEKPAEEAPKEEKPEGEKKDDKPAEKPAEEKPAEEAEKPAEAIEAEPITYEEFKFPEGVTSDAEQLGKFTEIVGKHRVPQEAAQELVDLYANSAKQFVESYSAQTLRDQHKAFADTRKEWVKQAMADEEIGGAAWNTSLGKIARMRDMFVPAEEMQAFNDFLNTTGAGDHPLFLKLMHRISRRFDEPSTAIQGKPPKNIGKPPGKRGMASLYDAPSTSHSR